MTPTGRGRGRPPVFEESARARFLTALEAGAAIAQAAKLAGVTRNVPARHARTDPAFAAALARARARGRAARAETTPHGESRYVHYGCRCGVCRKDASARRAGRRAATGPGRVPREEGVWFSRGCGEVAGSAL